jgi:hypothetical protein
MRLKGFRMIYAFELAAIALFWVAMAMMIVDVE